MIKFLPENSRKICFVTSNRADYGQLKDLILLVKKDKNLKLQVVVSGSHLIKKLGYTLKDLIKDKLKINFKVDLKIKNYSKKNICTYTGDAIKKFSSCFIKLNPDIIVVLGDRYEIFSAVTAALILDIPIAHLHGGEVTSGVIDESLRHSITKMSDIHFAANNKFKKRIIRMGENPKNVYNVGALTVENLNNFNFVNKKNLEKILNVNFLKKNLLITVHPEKSLDITKKLINNLLYSLKKLNNTLLIFTSSNPDAYSNLINQKIKRFVKGSKNSIYIANLGYKNYISCMKICDGVIGNSSSGITETPKLKVGSINIGQRQEGRPLSRSIIQVFPDKKKISKAIKKLYSKYFKNKIFLTNNYYKSINTKFKIIKILKNKKLEKIKTKRFID